MEWLEPKLNRRDLKPIIAIAVSIGACFLLRLDAVGALNPEAALGKIGYFLTGLVVAGGSAGAVKLFQDVLGFRRTSRDQLKAVQAVEREAELAEAAARVEKAKAEVALANTARTVATAQAVLPSMPGAGAEERILAARMAARDLKIAGVV